MTPAVYSVSSLAEHWGCGTDTIYSLIKSGALQSFRLGGKLIRIRADEVERFECQTTPSNDIEARSPLSGSRTDDATAIRLERLIARQPRPPQERSGNAAR